MISSDSYNTKQKKLILNIIKNKKHKFTIKDIYEELNKKVGLTTIYRLIDSLIEEGKDKDNVDIMYIKVINIKEIDSKGEEQYVYPCFSYSDKACNDLLKYDLDY